ncbi:MAG: HlyD family secretion protein [Epsilonproteobacteria bacterium]|nr:MAG: HlyD family secretion protein [Campylobacterota bacterium]
MGWLLMLIYNAFCMMLFRVFKIPLTKWTLSTAILGGFCIIGSLLALMNFNHPYSAVSREYFQTTPVIPAVKGRVISVEVEPNTPLKAGDVLFRIDPVPFQNKVDSLTAQLRAFRIDLDRATELFERQLGTERDVDVYQAKTDDTEAKLRDAQYDLEQTVVRAETDGHITQLIVHPGLYVVSTPLRPAMVFVQSKSITHIAWFRQNNLTRLLPGSKAEVAFDSIPGIVFTGEVIDYIHVLAEGELQAQGNLYDMSPNMKAGRIPVKIEITDPKFKEYAGTIPGGAFAQAAVYSDHGKQVAFLRKILLRMSSWMNYLFPFR